MAIEFNVSAMDRFRNADLGNNEEMMARIGPGGDVERAGIYGGRISAIGRGDDVKRANNRVRTELLKTLGNLFGLSGMTQSNGKVTFSQAFMDELERLLGRDFKRWDFEIKNGEVSSGKPLTLRRINAIFDKAEIAAAEARRTGGIKGAPAQPKELYANYFAKLEEVKTDLGLAGLTPAQRRAKLEENPSLKIFVRIEKSLDYLMNELDVEREPGEDDTSALRSTHLYDNHVNLYDEDPETFDGGPRFEFKDPATGKYYSLSNSDDLNNLNQQIWRRCGGTLIHTERVLIDLRFGTSIEPLKKYIVNTIKMFVMKGIDTYLEAKRQHKLDLYMEHIKKPGACMEDQGSKFQEFEDKHLVEAQPLDKKEIERLERIANQSVESEGPQKADKLICDTLADLPIFEEKDEWDEELATALKEKLVGKTCQMMTSEKTPHGTKFRPAENINGEPVVKKLTAEDIDILGPACFDSINGL